jgi:hypothetical protein
MNASIVYEKSDLEEHLVALYLRLNGYFTSGFIIHGNKQDKLRGEVDVLATRFPLNREPERKVGTSPELKVPTDRVDFIIGEVKNKKDVPCFNMPMYDIENIKYQLRWLGMFTDLEVSVISRELLNQLNTKDDGFPNVQWSQSDGGNPLRPPCQVRLILFDLNPENPTDPRCVSGEAVMKHTWACLRRDAQIKSCGRRYGYTAWGPVFEPMVMYFKDKKRKDHLGNVNEMIEQLCKLSPLK